MQERFYQRALKVKVAELKDVCDFLALDRAGKSDKTALLELLVDFCAEPKESMLKRSKAAAAASEKRANKSASTSAKSNDVYVQPTKGVMPSDEVLREWTRAFVH
jgi:hypothetical protein